MTSNLYNYSLSPYDTAQIFLPNKIPDEQLGTDQQTVEKPRAWSTGALDSISEGETGKLSAHFNFAIRQLNFTSQLNYKASIKPLILGHPPVPRYVPMPFFKVNKR